jgi:precorrin-2 C20-methyltransferase/precorrin-3B C17-methyltransferase
VRAAVEADLVLAVYNPASRTRREQDRSSPRTVARATSAGTPVVVGRNVGRELKS